MGAGRRTISRSMPGVAALFSLAFVSLISGVLPLPCSFAQAPGYSREEVTARAREVPEGIIRDEEPASLVGDDMLMSGSRSIGSARSKVRGGDGGQSAMLRYDQHREVEPPQYATLRIGPLYSDLSIAQSVGYRYIGLSGAGVDFLTGNTRGQFLKEGSDIPLVSTLNLNNYLMISRRMDLEANIGISYEHFPFKTQEDDLRIDITDEGVYGTFSSEYQISRDARLLLYDDILYRTDYVDERGLDDRYGGQEYEHFENTVGADWDWSPSTIDNVSISVSRSDTIPFDDEFENQEGVAYAEALGYQRQLSPFSVVGLLGSFSQKFYEDDTRPDLMLYGISSFAAAQLTRTVTGNASLGYQYSVYEGGNRDGSGRGSLSMGAGLKHQISEDVNHNVRYNRSQSEAFNGGIDLSDMLAYGLSWESGLFPGTLSTKFSSFDPQDAGRNGYSDWMIGLSLAHRRTRLLQVSLATSYGIRLNDDIGGLADPNTPGISSDYETWTIRLGAGMRLSKKTNFSAYAEHADRTSDNDSLAYTRDVIAATVTWTHQF